MFVPTIFRNENFYTAFKNKILYLLSDALKWATQRPTGTTSCL